MELCFRTHPDISSLVSPLENMIQARFIPSVTGQDVPGNLLRDLLTLPARHGGLGIIKPMATADRQFSVSLRVTDPLSSLIANLVSEYPLDVFYEQTDFKNCIRNKNRKWSLNEVDNLKPQFPFDLGRSMEFARERGITSWLVVFPIPRCGFALL